MTAFNYSSYKLLYVIKMYNKEFSPFCCLNIDNDMEFMMIKFLVPMNAISGLKMLV